MEIYLYRLHFKGPIHLGTYGIDLEAIDERLSSDSLTSALLNAVKVLEGDDGVIEMVDALLRPSPPFILSSLFPFGPDPENRHSYAEAIIRPMIDPPVAYKKVLETYGKEFKRIRYLSVKDFGAWIGKVNLTELQIKEIVERSKELTQGWWQEEIRPRVALDRISQNSSIWNQAALWFSKEKKDQEGKPIKGAGLYGLIRINDCTWKSRLESAFRMLGEMGIGGERTYGLGLYQFDGLEPLPDPWKNLFQQEARAHVLLSMYYPTDQEKNGLQDYLQAWETVERRGYIVSGRSTTTIKRKRVRMMIEGSATSKLLSGCMVDVTPDYAFELGIGHRVYRSGIAFLIPGRS